MVSTIFTSCSYKAVHKVAITPLTCSISLFVLMVTKTKSSVVFMMSFFRIFLSLPRCLLDAIIVVVVVPFAPLPAGPMSPLFQVKPRVKRVKRKKRKSKRKKRRSRRK